MQPIEDLESWHIRKIQVQQHQVWSVISDLVQRIRPTGGHRDGIPDLRESVAINPATCPSSSMTRMRCGRLMFIASSRIAPPVFRISPSGDLHLKPGPRDAADVGARLVLGDVALEAGLEHLSPRHEAIGSASRTGKIRSAPATAPRAAPVGLAAFAWSGRGPPGTADRRPSAGGRRQLVGVWSRSQSKRDRSCRSRSPLAIEYEHRSGSTAIASARSGNLREWSTPFRLTRRTVGPSLYARIRQPSSLLLVDPAVPVEGLADQHRGHGNEFRNHESSISRAPRADQPWPRRDATTLRTLTLCAT